MAKAAQHVCSCGTTFKATNGQLWCPACASSVEAFKVSLSAKQRAQIEARAIVRGVSPEQFVRDAIEALCRPKQKRLTKEQRVSLKRPKKGKNPHTGARIGGRRRPLEP